MCPKKKQSEIRIPSSLSRTQPIITSPDKLFDYVEFSTFIKDNACFLDGCQNVIYFGDNEEEQQFIFNIQSLLAVIAGKTSVDIPAVTLNTDLTKRLVTWDKVSEIVIQDLVTPSPKATKKPSIASIHDSSK